MFPGYHPQIEENGLSEASSPLHENTGFMAYNALAGTLTLTLTLALALALTLSLTLTLALALALILARCTRTQASWRTMPWQAP